MLRGCAASGGGSGGGGNITSELNQPFSPAPSWTGTTPPSGTANTTYSWVSNGTSCQFWINLRYSVAGASLTAVTVDYPASAPKPLDTPAIQNNEAAYPGEGRAFTTDFTGNGQGATIAVIKTSSSATGYRLTLKGMNSNPYIGVIAAFSFPIATS